MNIWFGKAAALASLVGFIIIRAPHGKRSRTARVAENHVGPLEVALLAGATLGTTLLPVIWAVTGFPSRADFPLHPVLFLLGLLFMVAGFWLFHRSHVDLGRNWSVTLQVREEHRLVTNGVYRRIRHPMYSSM